MYLNAADKKYTAGFDVWNVTDTNVELNFGFLDGSNNPTQSEYVAYLFAHDDSDEGLIQCGSYTGTGAAGNEIDLGWEPQWLMIKNASSAAGWVMYDTMRGFGANDIQRLLYADTSAAEGDSGSVSLSSTGFDAGGGQSAAWVASNKVNDEYIYMAIRRPNKPASEFEPEELFAIKEGDGSSYPGYVSGFPVDAVLNTQASGGSHLMISRMTSQQLLVTSSTAAEAFNDKYTFDYSDGWFAWTSAATGFANMWRRAPGFFDVVCYEGENSTGRAVTHNLGAVPEMIWVRGRNSATQWGVYHAGITSLKQLALDRDLAEFVTDAFADTNPTASSFYLGYDFNGSSSSTYIAYLFASVPGICDIGTYTGDTSTNSVMVDCGFTNGPRFVLIKRTDANGDWMYWDSLRGLGFSGNPMLKLNDTDAQVANDYIQAESYGFRARKGEPTNIDGAEYIYMAIA
jgi:hypothetical protein